MMKFPSFGLNGYATKGGITACMLLFLKFGDISMYGVSEMLCSMPRGQSSGHPALAHLLAAHSSATPKQAKEPIFATHKYRTENIL